MATDNDNRQFGVVALDGFQNFDAVLSTPLQPDVEDDQVGLATVDLLERGIGTGGCSCLMPLVFQDFCDQLANVFFVVDDQNIGH